MYSEDNVHIIIEIALGILLLIYLIFYVMHCIGLQRMAKAIGIKNHWLVWIPLVNFWVIGEMVSDKLKGHGGWKFLAAWFGNLLFMMIPFINLLVAIGFIVFCGFIWYWIFNKFSRNPLLHTIVSFIIPAYFSIIVFLLSKNEPKSL